MYCVITPTAKRDIQKFQLQYAEQGVTFKLKYFQLQKFN